MKIYLARNGVQAGPYDLTQLNTMLSSGEVVPDDLMWHTGMDNWQKVGTMTHGQTFYQPTSNTPKPQSVRGFGDNVDFVRQEEQVQNERRAKLDQLYGRQSHPSPIRLTKSHQTQPTDDTLVYASVGQRFMAFVINVALYVVVWLPLFVAFFGAMDASELAKTTDYASAYAYSEKLAQSVPQSTKIISNVLFLVLLATQSLLVVMRGQSLGKLAMSIRVVDEKTHKLPSFFNLFFMRTMFLVVAYCLGAIFMSSLPAFAMLIINYLMAKSSPTKQGWHDKLTKTVVVKARPSQLDKTKSS